MIVRGWDLRAGKAQTRSFNVIGFTWTKLLQGVVVYVGVSPLFMLYVGGWRVPTRPEMEVVA